MSTKSKLVPPLTVEEKALVAKFLLILHGRKIPMTIREALKILGCSIAEFKCCLDIWNNIDHFYTFQRPPNNYDPSKYWADYGDTISHRKSINKNTNHWMLWEPRNRRRRIRECNRCGQAVAGGIRHGYSKREEGEHTMEECNEFLCKS